MIHRWLKKPIICFSFVLTPLFFFLICYDEDLREDLLQGHKWISFPFFCFIYTFIDKTNIPVSLSLSLSLSLNGLVNHRDTQNSYKQENMYHFMLMKHKKYIYDNNVLICLNVCKILAFLKTKKVLLIFTIWTKSAISKT